RVRTPQRLENGAMSQDPARMPGKKYEKVELLRRETNLCLVAQHAVAIEIDDEVAGRQLACRGRDVPGVAQRDSNPCQQLVRSKRLRHVVVCPGVERSDLVPLASSG